jgi:hypothetical protein
VGPLLAGNPRAPMLRSVQAEQPRAEETRWPGSGVQQQALGQSSPGCTPPVDPYGFGELRHIS